MPEFLLQCQGTIHTLSTPWIMGILNSTPDSFYAGSRLNAPQEAAERARSDADQVARASLILVGILHVQVPIR
jgi:dihydropteroate synthase